MEIKKTNNKWKLAKAYINTWLKDKTKYCNNCNTTYSKSTFPCCKNPQLGNNMFHTKAVIDQNKEIRQTRRNQYASDEGKNLRWGISLPPRLYGDLRKYFKNECNEKLFRDDKDVKNFMKNFPQFRIPKKM